MSTIKLENLSHYGDILAIPMFILAFVYFYRKNNRSLVEQILLAFVTIALICDIGFTIIFIKDSV